MSPSIAIQDLLNPMQHPPVAIPISSLLNPAPQNAAPVENQSVNTSSERTVLHNNYKLTRKTTLSVVYRYPVDAILEYPETGVDGGEVVGHLFAMKEDAWFSPSRDFAYSRGEPSGKAKETVTVPLLVDSVTGEPVPCITRHATCLGVKVCPYSDLQDAQNPHSSPTRSQVSQRCSASADEASSEILPSNMERLALRRGYPDVQNRCEGRLVYSLSFEGTPYIKVLRGFVNRRRRGEYEPLEEYRAACPYFLVTSKGPHSHPIPLPEKTPTTVKVELGKLFKKLGVDLADIMPRKFLRHPIVQLYLSARYPFLRNPMLSDLHISLSNRSHLKVYLDTAKKTHFPEGTGWKGLLHIKTQQDQLLEPIDRYIRFMKEIDSMDSEDTEEEDEDVCEDQGQPRPSDSEALKIVICMTSSASKRLVEAQHLQSDIGFKRIVGFYESEIASVERYSNTSITFCRVYLTRQTAQAHLIVLREINKILVSDTGRGLRWRHIHGLNVGDYDNVILNWVVDQHRGQAKEKIRTLGGRAGQNWVLDKETSQFAFPGMCWEKSFIPMDIWQARRRESNIVEVVHANVNLEGKWCTLVGGMYKGKHYDLLKQQVLANRENFGIRESYSTKHSYENALRNVKRQSPVRGRKRKLGQEDAKIEGHNRKITELLNKSQLLYEEAKRRYDIAYPSINTSSPSPPALVAAYQKAQASYEKARVAFRKQATVGEGLIVTLQSQIFEVSEQLQIPAEVA
ncbi:hypothetical protein BT96DRAFT_950559 [Gymnopus androsaceus JB14]|uniref:Uncharacterized protein n=1 Tax=Gymnopus androsaceus JB14 TaxID=1447944 RepID=A0A6A4GGN6_9AGAR|nr:hypothetical protein BT96DRAFT_950559 [Gymnopus androsaceus JB14]